MNSRAISAVKHSLAAIALAAGCAALPGQAAAATVFLLDTGAPPANNPLPDVLNSAQALAGEFSATAGETITNLSAYLSQSAGDQGKFFTFELFSATGFINGRSLQPVFTPVTATYTGTGWNSAAVNWNITTTGNYWLAIFSGSGSSFIVPTGATGGTVAALGDAFSTAGRFQTMGDNIGLQVTAVSPVPEPTTALGMLLGLAALGAAGFKRRAQSPRA